MSKLPALWIGRDSFHYRTVETRKRLEADELYIPAARIRELINDLRETSLNFDTRYDAATKRGWEDCTDQIADLLEDCEKET